LDILKIFVTFYNFINRISFIGHSLGGLIIRAALPHLKEYKDQFYTYMTLSTPHLGLLYGNSSLVDAGSYFQIISYFGFVYL